MNKKYIGYGERPSDKDFFKITKTQYDPQPEQNIGNYELILNTPTVKAYLDRPSETIVLSIRGTTDGRDVTADTMIPFNRLKYSNRYNEDKNIIASLINQYPPDDYDYYGTGHSLGSALLRQLQREFPFIKDTVTFNGAVQPYDIIDQKANLNKSYYTEDDALYKLGGRLLNNKVVIPSTVHTLKIPSVLPTPAPVKVGSFVYNASQGHKLDNFEGVLGGAISRMREKLQKMTVKEIKEAVKNELNGAIKGYSKMKKEDLINAIRDYQKKKKGSKKSEEPKIKETPIKVSKREQFLLDEREKKVIYITEQLIDKLPDIYKSISELVKFKKIKNKCKKLYAKSKNMLLRIEDDKPTIDLFDKKNDKIKDKYGVGCPKNRRGINLTGANDIFKEKLRYINNLINEFFFIFIDRGIYREPYYYLNWYRNKYPEEQKKLSIKYVKNGMGWTDNFRLTDKELEQINKGIEIGTKGLFNKVPDFEKLKDELNILEKEILYSGDDFDYYRNYKKSEEPKTKGGCCMCHTKDVVRGGAIEERKIESLEDFKTTELRKIASIFNKFFKIKLTKLTRNEIIRELSKYIYLNESGSIFVNEDDLFFSLKPKDVLKEIESKKLQNKIKKEAKPKTRREILQKEKIGVLKALLISLGGDPTYKLNGRITQFPKRSVIDEILVLERKIRKE